MTTSKMISKSCFFLPVAFIDLILRRKMIIINLLPYAVIYNKLENYLESFQHIHEKFV
jgi:hypothetical protein